MAQVKRRLSAAETASRLGLSVRQFRRMVAVGTVRPIGKARAGVASSFDARTVEQVAAGRDYAAALGRVAWNVQTGHIRPGFQFWFRHDSGGDYRGALRVLDETCPDYPPPAFKKIAQQFAEGFAPGPIRYAIGVLFLHAYGQTVKRVRPMPPDARRFYARACEHILGESLDETGRGISKATRERQAALGVFMDSARSGDFDTMKDVVRRFAPNLLRDGGTCFSIGGAADFMRWHRRTYGTGRRGVKPPKRAAVARLIPSPENPRVSLSRPVVSRIACAFEGTLRQSGNKRRLFSLLVCPAR